MTSHLSIKREDFNQIALKTRSQSKNKNVDHGQRNREFWIFFLIVQYNLSYFHSLQTVSTLEPASFKKSIKTVFWKHLALRRL